jgi:hypothetical protein
MIPPPRNMRCNVLDPIPPPRKVPCNVPGTIPPARNGQSGVSGTIPPARETTGAFPRPFRRFFWGDHFIIVDDVENGLTMTERHLGLA